MKFDAMTFLVASSALTLIVFAYIALRAIFVFVPVRKTNHLALKPASLVSSQSDLFNPPQGWQPYTGAPDKQSDYQCEPLKARFSK